MFGFIAAASVIYVAIKANLDRASQPVEGSGPGSAAPRRCLPLSTREGLDQRRRAHRPRETCSSTTANWAEAIVHYRFAIAKDSSRTSAIVDLGVCYYNLSQPARAEELFQLALSRIRTNRWRCSTSASCTSAGQDHAGAMSYFHRALESQPPEEMKSAIIEAMQRTQQETGNNAPPLPQPR